MPSPLDALEAAMQRVKQAHEQHHVTKHQLHKAEAEVVHAERALWIMLNVPKGNRKLITRRQAEVLEYIKQHKTNKEIAAALNISERTVKFHVSELLQKFDYQHRSQLFTINTTKEETSNESVLPA